MKKTAAKSKRKHRGTSLGEGMDFFQFEKKGAKPKAALKLVPKTGREHIPPSFEALYMPPALVHPLETGSFTEPRGGPFAYAKEEPIHLRLIEPTASKTDLYLACPWPWGRTAPAEVFDTGGVAFGGPLFGSAFHEVMAKWLLNPPNPSAARPNGGLRDKGVIEAASKKFGADPATLRERAEAAFPVLQTWLYGGNQWSIDFGKPPTFAVEQSVAYNPTTDEARLIAGPTEDDHRYLDRLPGEITGTVDVASVVVHPLKGHRTVLVLDHKSGWRVSADWQPHTPAESGQLRTLALALCRLHDADCAIVAYFHAPPNTPPVVHADVLDAADLNKHRLALIDAADLTNSGFMRPGPHCADCPTFLQCPTQTTSLAELKKIGGIMTPERVGAIHQATAEFDSLRDRLRSDIRAWVKANGAGVRPDGQYVDIVVKEVTGLSQASIVRALGPLKGKAMIEKLKSLGCVETQSREELRAMKR